MRGLIRLILFIVLAFILLEIFKRKSAQDTKQNTDTLTQNPAVSDVAFLGAPTDATGGESLNGKPATDAPPQDFSEALNGKPVVYTGKPVVYTTTLCRCFMTPCNCGVTNYPIKNGYKALIQ